MGWIEEKSKLEDMGAAGGSPHLFQSDNWQVKMRIVNRDIVLPRQVASWLFEIIPLTFSPSSESSFPRPALPSWKEK